MGFPNSHTNTRTHIYMHQQLISHGIWFKTQTNRYGVDFIKSPNINHTNIGFIFWTCVHSMIFFALH